MVRAKFRLQSVTSNAGYTGQQLVFTAVSPPDGEIEENKKFHKYTPQGELKMTVDNPPAQEQFKVGEYYYLDFTPVPSPA